MAHTQLVQTCVCPLCTGYLTRPALPPPAACRIALLTFTSLGWRLPHRLHMVVQAVNVLLLIRFGIHSYCDSKVGGEGRARCAQGQAAPALPPA